VLSMKKPENGSNQFDVVVIGGGTAGWIAALSAAREGKSTALVERKGYCGGVLSSGLSIYGFHDTTHRQIVRGYAEEFVKRLAESGGSDGYVLLDLWHASMVPVDPAIVKPVIMEMLYEAGVQTILFSQVIEVVRNKRRIEGVVLQQKSGRCYIEGKMFIDASGDAIVSYLAGLPVVECDEQQPPTLVLRLENVRLDELREFLVQHPDQYVNWRLLPGKSVTEDFLRKACKFMILPDLMKTFEYAGDYLPLINRVMFTCTAGGTGVSINMLRAHSIDGTSSESLTRASFDVYRNVLPLVEFFRTKVPGFSQCRLMDCEPEIQLRETRRIVGAYSIEVEDIMQGLMPEDSVAMGGYFIDIHSAKDSGGTWEMIEGGYGIPYRALYAADADNLFAAGRCISGSTKAAGSYRVMATSMAMGQAVGTAASMCVDRGVSAKALKISDLQKRLESRGALLR
jgi:FAD dependent oxidoreductase